MTLALGTLVEKKQIKSLPVKDYLAATSVGILSSSEAILDLNYEEDAEANVDMNIVMTGKGEFVEIQGTGEEATFSKNELFTMLSLADEGLQQLFELQKEILGELGESIESTKAPQGERN